MTQSTDFLAELAALAEKATPGPWELQDGNSWRRIGTSEQDGAVLYPTTYSATDRHPDLSAARGNDLYANLALIVMLRNNLPAILAMGRERDALRSALARIAGGNDGKPAYSAEASQLIARQALEGGNQ